jgi:1,4-dihydroxy-2-naphthoyl-CoA synthase
VALPTSTYMSTEWYIAIYESQWEGKTAYDLHCGSIGAVRTVSLLESTDKELVTEVHRLLQEELLTAYIQVKANFYIHAKGLAGLTALAKENLAKKEEK